MPLSPEQTAAVASWVAAGDNLSTVQKKLREEFGVSMTYMDVRFLVDDLDLQLKDPVRKPAPAPAPSTPPSSVPPSLRPSDPSSAPHAAEDGFADEDLPPPAPAGANIRVTVDSVTLIPGALASGSVTFSDGVTGKWIVDNTGRPGFTEVSQPGYRPTPADAQAFMQELSHQLQQRGY